MSISVTSKAETKTISLTCLCLNIFMIHLYLHADDLPFTLFVIPHILQIKVVKFNQSHKLLLVQRRVTT